MKKVLSIVAIALVAVTFASCEKSYTCECTYPNPAGGANLKWSSTFEAKKSEAKDACNSLGSIYIIGGGSCSLK